MSEIMRPTHKGLLLGIVPVYLDYTDPDDPVVAGRFFGCELLLSIVVFLFGVYVTVVMYMNPEFEPMFPIKITGQVSGIEVKR